MDHSQVLDGIYIYGHRRTALSVVSTPGTVRTSLLKNGENGIEKR